MHGNELVNLHLCEEQSLSDMLKLAFRGRPGISWINAGAFTIKSLRHKLLLPWEWGHTVKPGMALVMSNGKTSYTKAPLSIV